MKKTISVILALFIMAAMISAGFAADGYTVYCVDENGAPVEGVKVQLCDDKTCSVKKTDADGAAYFGAAAPGAWEVHIAKVPEGYVKPEEVVMTSKDGSDITFTVPTEAGAAAAAETAVDHTDDATATQEYTSLDDINFADYNLVMVNYWEPWCYYCLLEMPDFEELYQEYKDQGLLIVGLYRFTDDFDEAIEEVGGISYPLIQYEETPDCIALNYGVPATYFYDSEGNILAPTQEEIASFVTKLWKEQIAAFDSEDYDTEEELEAVRKEIEELSDETYMKEAVWKAAEEVLAECPDFFSGYAYGENWRERIENRLNP